MGQSTDGIIFFGFNLGSSDDGFSLDELWGVGVDDADWEAEYAKRKGILPPSEEYDDSPEVQKKHHDYWEVKRKLVAAEPCSIDFHCSGDYPVYYVSIKRTQKRARRGYPEELTVTDFNVRDSEVQQLKEFCEFMGIEWQEPKWWLASLWM